MAQRLLFIVAVLLAMGVGSLWLDESGRLRSQHWASPSPLLPDLSNGHKTKTAAAHQPVQHLAVLDRPLFAPDRLPPPAADLQPLLTPAPPPPPDPLLNLVVVGLYQREGVGGLLGRLDGRVRRISVNEKLGDWTLSGIEGNEAVFNRDSEQRRFRLVPGSTKRELGIAAKETLRSALPMSPVAQFHDVEAERQLREEATRENTRRQNEIRAKAGLKPIRD